VISCVCYNCESPYSASIHNLVAKDASLLSMTHTTSTVQVWQRAA